MIEPSKIAVIIPVLNEAGQLKVLLDQIERLTQQQAQVIVVDGGSQDGTYEQLSGADIDLVRSAKGRAVQMNTGYKQTKADCYWFLHADCIPPDNAIKDIQQALSTGKRWGRFDVNLTSHKPAFRMIERMMNWRSCFTQVATGDQGIFVEGNLLDTVGGIPNIPLMEDIALSKQLRKHGRGACIQTAMIVSSRRWEKSGIVYMTLLMWWLRLRYFLGADPAQLHKSYYGQ